MMQQRCTPKARFSAILAHSTSNPWTLFRVILLTSVLVASAPGRAGPVPITLNGNDEWVRNPSADFPVSELTLNVRRFAQLPQLGPLLPRPLGVRTIDGDDRLFVVLQTFDNQLLELAPDGSSASSIFSPRPSGLRNVRDIVFHPQFYDMEAPGYGKLYTLTTMSKPANPEEKNYLGDSSPTAGDNLLAEWTATFDESGVFDGVDANSYRELFRVAQTRGDHPIGQGGFNPFAAPGDDDYGMLYLAIGDSFEGSIVSQDGQSALGKTFRINPLQDGDNPYSIPADNPFVDDASTLDEIYTIGHRNPHSLSFAQDDQGGVHLFIGEIGENQVEEISLVSQGGGNYGWGEREGTIDRSGEPDTGFIYPVAQYGHDGAGPHAIAGGYVVNNGSALDGQYFFGDFPETGALFTFAFEDALNATLQGEPQDLTPLEIETVDVLFDDDDDPSTPSMLTNLRDMIMSEDEYDGSGRLDIRFAQGAKGELYVLNKRNTWIYLVTNSLAHDADFDGNGVVDDLDLAKWEADFGQNSGSDANFDGDSDGADFLIWQRQNEAAGPPAGNVAPEPKSLAILAIACVGCAISRKVRLISFACQ